jgi:putative peptidoglycan lipid II flippase
VPVAWNAVIIGVLVGCAPFLHTTDARLYAYAAGILLGTAVQFVLPLPWLRGRGGRITLTVDWRDPAVARVFVLMLPVALGLGLINFNVGVDTWFAARIDPFLAPTAIDRAFRIYVLPQGIFSVAVAAVAFPALSRAAAGRRGEEFRDLVSTSLRQIAFLLFPASAVCLILADPIVRLLYQRGAFDAGDTTVVAQALQAFSIGLAFNGAIVLLNRAFFSLQHAWTPTWIALGNLFVNALLDWTFYRPFGIWGIPLATSLTNIVAVVALVACLQPLAGSLDVRATLASCGRILLATLALAAVADPVWRVLDQALGRSLPAQVLSLGSALALGTAAYLLAARALGLEEVALLGTVRRRLAR